MLTAVTQPPTIAILTQLLHRTHILSSSLLFTPRPLSPSRLLSRYTRKWPLKSVVLNACFTLKHGERLLETGRIESVVCYEGKIEDRIATGFVTHYIRACSDRGTRMEDACTHAKDTVSRELESSMDLKAAGIDNLRFLSGDGGGSRAAFKEGSGPRWYENSVCQAKTEHFKEVWADRPKASFAGDDDGEGKAAAEDEPLPIIDEMRSYQREVFAQVADGENRVLVLPTGAGKTLVAAKLCQHVALDQWNKVIIFAAQQIPLVFQQAAYLEAQTGLRVQPLCGAMEIVDWEVVMASNDIIVVTAGLLVQALEAHRVILSEVSLLIFDEVHHATKRHPFNDIMQSESRGGEVKQGVVRAAALYS